MLRRAQVEVNESVDAIAEGRILCETADRTAMNAAHCAGYLEGLRFFLDFEGDGPEEEKGPDQGSFTYVDEPTDKNGVGGY